MLAVEGVASESFRLGEGLPGTLAAQPRPSARDAEVGVPRFQRVAQSRQARWSAPAKN